MPKYHKVQNGELVKVGRLAKWACCDCGLVHIVRFEMTGNHDLRAWKDNRATAAKRRKKK